MREKIEISPTLNNLMDDDSRVAIDLFLLVSNIIKGNVWCVGFCHFIFKKYEERKTPNMFFLMLDPRFKLQILVSSFIGHEQGILVMKNMIQIIISYNCEMLSSITFIGRQWDCFCEGRGDSKLQSKYF